MDLLANPFFTLGATTRDNRRRIMALAQEKILTADEAMAAAVRDAKAVLVHPKRRLAAEISWLPGLAPEHISDALSTLQQDPVNLLILVHLPSLARANLLAAGLIRAVKGLPKSEIARWILELAQVHDATAAEPTMALLNEERSWAGFPAITGPQIVAAELQEQEQYYGQAIKKALDQLSHQSLVEVVTTAVDQATNRGENHAPVLIEKLVNRFEVDVQEFFDVETKKIEDLVQRIQRAVEKNQDHEQINRHVSKLENTLRDWDQVAQPIQMSARSRGTDHDLSHEIATKIRSLAIDLFNKHGLLDISKRLTRLQQEVFAEIDTIVETLNEDTTALDKISKQRADVSNQDMLNGLLKLLFKLLFWPFILLALGGLGSLFQSNHKATTVPSRTQSPPSTPSLSSSSPSRTSEVKVPSSESNHKATTVPSRTQSPPPTLSLSSSSPSRTSEVRVPSPELKFSKPPLGDDNILSIAQIRWCLREGIRIEALRPKATTSLQIDQFNAIIDDYNRHCGSYRYREGTLERAQREVENMKSQIIEDASLWSPFTVPSRTQSPPSTPSLSSSSPSRTSEVRVPSSELKFFKPPAGNDNILLTAQIRWCLREGIRIEALRPKATTNLQIDQFNAIIDDYNRHCESYRYREVAFKRAQREVEDMKSQIIEDASLWSPFVDSLSNDLRQE